jgi:hypothetical protein
MFTKITLTVAALLGLISAVRVSQFTARYNPVLESYYNDDLYDDDYDDDEDYYYRAGGQYYYQPSYLDYNPYYRPEVRAEVQLHLANELTKLDDIVEKLLNNTDLSPLLIGAKEVGNKLFDRWQDNLRQNLMNFGSDDVKGLFKLIPKGIRKATSGITASLADDIQNLGDAIQDAAN